MKRFVATNFALLLVSLAFAGTSHAVSPLGGPGFGPAQPLIVTPAIQATGWARNTLMDPVEYAHTKATDIRLRPNRFLHFYGNTVRFFYYSRLARQNCHLCLMLHADAPVVVESEAVTVYEHATDLDCGNEGATEESVEDPSTDGSDTEAVEVEELEVVFSDGAADGLGVTELQ